LIRSGIWQTAEGTAQQLRRVLLDLDDVAEIIHILEGAILPLPAIAKETAVLAAFVGYAL
jgi:hypothetical protein